jgi:hypothetical protein
MTNIYVASVLVFLVGLFYIRDSGVFGSGSSTHAKDVSTSSSSSSKLSGADTSPLSKLDPNVAKVLKTMNDFEYSHTNPVMKVLFCTS